MFAYFFWSYISYSKESTRAQKEQRRNKRPQGFENHAQFLMHIASLSPSSNRRLFIICTKSCVLNEDIKKYQTTNAWGIRADVVMKSHMDQNNVVFKLKGTSENQSKWTHYTHFTWKYRFECMMWFYYLTSLLNWFYALPCFAYFCCMLCWSECERFWNISAQSIKQFLGDMRSIFPSLHHHHRLYKTCIKTALGSILASISKVNQAWNEHEAWVCQGDKNYLRVGKLDNHIIGDNDSFRLSPEESRVESRVTEDLQASTRMFRSWTFQFHIFLLRHLFFDFLRVWCVGLTTRTQCATSRLISSIITLAIYTEIIKSD